MLTTWSTNPHFPAKHHLPFKIDAGLPRLRLLIPPFDAVDSAVLFKKPPGLVEVKGHAVPDALVPGDENPLVIAEPRTRPGLAAAGNAFDHVAVLRQIAFNVDGLEHRFVDDGLVTDGQGQKNRKAAVRLLLIFTGAADVDVVPAAAPVLRQMVRDAFRPLRNEIKAQI